MNPSLSSVVMFPQVAVVLSRVLNPPISSTTISGPNVDVPVIPIYYTEYTRQVASEINPKSQVQTFFTVSLVKHLDKH